MPNFPAIGHNVDAEFMAIVDPASVTHPLPVDGQSPWGDTFRLWSGDVEDSVNNLETAVEDVADDVDALDVRVDAVEGAAVSLDTRVDALEAAPPTAPADASTTVKGITRFATPVEAEAGTSAVIAVTPLGLETVLATFLSQIFGPGISRVEPITRTAYTALTPKVATTLYVIDETL